MKAADAADGPPRREHAGVDGGRARGRRAPRRSRGIVPPAGGVLHGGAEKYRGAARIKDACAIQLEQIVPDPNQPRKEFDPGRSPSWPPA